MRFTHTKRNGFLLGLLAGDVDGNGEVNSLDALMIMRYVLGLIPEL